MSIFGNNSGMLYDVPVNENYTVLGGDMIAIEEAAQDMESVIESMYVHDMAELQRNREVMALESSNAREYEIARVKENYDAVMESAMGDAWDKLKKMLSNLWSKLKGYFKNLIRFFDGFILSGKKFVTKYESQLTSLSLNGFKYNMFNWNNANLEKSDDVSGYPAVLTKIINKTLVPDGNIDTSKLNDNKNKAMNLIRGHFVGASEVKSEDFNEKLFGHFRNGARDKSDRKETTVDIGSLIEALKDDEQLNKVKKLEKEIDRVFNDQLKELEEGKKKVEDSDKKDANSISFHQKRCAAFSEAHGIALTFVREWKSAYVARNSEYKGACVAAFRYKEDK